MKQVEYRNLLIDLNTDLFWVVDLNFLLVYANKSYLDFMKEEVGIEKKLHESALVKEFGEDDVKRWKGYYIKALKGEGFEIDEHLYRENLNEIQYSQIKFQPLKNEENKVYAVACQSNNVTRLVKEKFEAKQLMDASLDVFCTINKKEEFVYVSKGSTELWGYLPEELIGVDYKTLVFEDDRTKTNEITTEIFKGKEVFTFANRYTKKDGSLAYNLWSTRWDNTDKVYYCVARDGKHRAEQEEKIKLSEERFKALVQEGSERISILDEEGNYLYVSPNDSSLLGFHNLEFIGRNAAEFIHPEDADRVRACMQTVLTKKSKLVLKPVRMLNKNKEWIWMETVLTNMLEIPSVKGIVANSRNITEKIEQEAIIRQSEERFKALVQGSFDLIGIIDIEGNYTYMSPSCTAITGMPPELFIGVNSFDFIHPDDIERALISLKKAATEERVIMAPFRAKNNKNEWRWVEAALTNMLDKPEVNGIVINSRDVTDQIEQDEKIQQSEQRFKALVQGGVDVTGILDTEGNYIYVSPASTALLGMDPIEFIGKNAVEFMHPDDVEKSLVDFQRVITEKKVELAPFRFLNKNNKVRWIETVMTNMLDNPAVKGIVANSRDITEKIQQKEKNKLIQQRYESLVENSMDCIVIISPEGKTTYVSGSIKKMLGYSPDEVMDLNIWGLCHPDDLLGSENAMAQCIKFPGIPMEGYVSRIKHKNGSWRWIKPIITNMLHDPSINGFVDNFRDITDEVEEKQKLKLLESVIINTKDAVLITELELNEPLGSKIIYVNEAFTKMTGYIAEEVVGKSPDILRGPKSNTEELAKLKHSLNNWQSHEMTVVNYKKNGEEFWNNFTVTPVANESGKYTHWVSIERDITEQKLKELEKDFINRITDVFHQSFEDDLVDCLTGVCELVAKFGEFDFAEIWLPNINNKVISQVANYVTGEVGNVFYSADNNIKSFDLGIGMPGYVWENKTTEIWGRDDEKWTLFIRKLAAKKAGVGAIMGIPLKHKDEVIGVLLLGTEKTKLDLAPYQELFKKIGLNIGGELSRKELEIELIQMFNFTPDMICIAGFDGYIKRINPAGLNLLGYSLEEIQSRPIRSFIHEGDRQRTSEQQQRLYNGVKLSNFENRYITKKGEVVWLSWTASSSSEHGTVYAVAKNITEEKKLRELNRQVGSLAKIGSWEVDLVSQHVYWSDVVHQIHETDSKNYVPTLEAGISFYRSDFQNVVSSIIKKSILTGSSFDFEAVVVTAQNKERWIRSYGSTEIIDGESKRIYGSFQDIQDRKEAEMRLQSLADNLPGVVFQYLVYPDGTEVFKSVTKGSLQVWGYLAEEINENSQLIWDRIKSGGEFDLVRKSIVEAVSFKEKWTCRFKYVMPSGELRTHLGIGTPNFLSDGTVLFNSIIFDVTQEAKNEEILEQTAKMARIGSWEMGLINKKEERVYWSPTMKRIFEVENNYSPNLTDGIGFHINESNKRIKDKVNLLINEGVEFDEELLLLTGKGNERWVRAIGKSEVADNKRVKIYGSYQDIHDQKISALELEKSLKELKDYKFSLDQSAIIAFTDKKGVITSVNDNFCETSKYERSEIVGKTHQLINANYHPKEFFVDLWKTISSGKVWRGEIKNKAKDGTCYWVDTTIVPFLDKKNKPFQYLAIRFDITERKKTEQEKNSLQITLENSLNEIYIFDAVTYQFSYVNVGALHNLGYSKQEMLALTPFDINPEYDLKSFKELLTPIVNNENEKILFFTYHKRKDGTKYPIEVHLQLVKEDNNSRFLAVVLDITERNKAEEKILQANERFKKVTEATNDAIWDWDLVNETFYRSQAIEKFFGSGALSSITEADFWKEKFHPDDLDQIKDSINAAISNPETNRWEFEYKILNEQDQIIYVNNRGVIIRDNQGVAIRMVGAMTDVSEQKQMALELKALNKDLKQHMQELERSNEELEQFAFVASHDLQEPLRMISSFMDLLKLKYEDKLDEKGLQYIHFATDGAKRMKQIILDLLDYSRAGRLAEGKEEVDMNDVISEFQLLRRKLISEIEATITKKNLPKIKTSKAAVTQIIHCLLDNALKYSSDGVSPVVEVSAIEREIEWEFSIKDNGIGIEPQFFEKIFLIFQRLHNNDKYTGTGIGLPIAKRHVELLEGRIWVDSQPGEGTVFYFTIPK